MMISNMQLRGLGPVCVVLVMMMAGGLASISEAAVWYVDDDRTATTPDGLSWNTAFPSIQDAIDAAVEAGASEDDPAEVWVAEGNYTGSGDYVVEMAEYVDLYGGFSGDELERGKRDWVTNETKISPYGRRRAVKGTDYNDIDGFIIRFGRTSDDENGAGILNENASPNIRNCTFYSNKTEYGKGAGIYNKNSSPEITNCLFRNNSTSSSRGAAIYSLNSLTIINNCTFSNNIGTAIVNESSSSQISHCTFTDNYSGEISGIGGGIYNSGSSITISDCNFIDNIGVQGGGAIYNTQSNLIIKNSSFNHNHCETTLFAGVPQIIHGGAINNNSSDISIIGCTFFENTTNYGGGAGISNHLTKLEVQNTLFVRNRASGIRSGGAIRNSSADIKINNCTFIDNTDESSNCCISSFGLNSSITNSIFWNNNRDVYPTTASTTNIRYNCISSDFTGEGNIDADPLFTDPNNGDFTLQTDSPCIDAGTREYAPTIDITGMGRPQGGLIDMGAYEKAIGGGIFFSN